MLYRETELIIVFIMRNSKQPFPFQNDPTQRSKLVENSYCSTLNIKENASVNTSRNYPQRCI